MTVDFRGFNNKHTCITGSDKFYHESMISYQIKYKKEWYLDETGMHKQHFFFSRTSSGTNSGFQRL